MKEEVATLRGREAFPNFYERLEQAKEYHQRFPNLPVKHHVSLYLFNLVWFGCFPCGWPVGFLWGCD